MVDFENNTRRSVYDFAKENALNAQLFTWMQSVYVIRNKSKKKDSLLNKLFCSEDKHPKIHYWKYSFSDAYLTLRELERCSVFEFVSYNTLVNRDNNTQIHLHRYSVPFTLSVIYAYMRIDKRFQNRVDRFSIDLYNRLKKWDEIAFWSLTRIINDIMSEQATIEINNKNKDINIEVLNCIATQEHEEKERLKKEKETLENELDKLQKQNKMSETEMMALYFGKIANKYLEKNRKKKLEQRETVKNSLHSIISSLRLQKYLSDELLDEIDCFDNVNEGENPTINVQGDFVANKHVENEVNGVNAGGIGITNHK